MTALHWGQQNFLYDCELKIIYVKHSLRNEYEGNLRSSEHYYSCSENNA